MTSPPRVFVPGSRLAPGESVPLSDAEARHLRVSRVAPGAAVVLLDGAGGRADARLAPGGREAVVEKSLPARGEPARRVTLLLGVGELARVEWAVEKGTECGAVRFALVAGARSQRAHVAAATARIERLRRIAVEAVKQCDRSVVPEVVPPDPLADVLGRCGMPVLVARPGAPPLGPSVRLRSACAVAIGPEGGFDDEEEALLDRAGAVPFGLGSRILRLETAVVAALARLVADDDP